MAKRKSKRGTSSGLLAAVESIPPSHWFDRLTPQQQADLREVREGWPEQKARGVTSAAVYRTVVEWIPEVAEVNQGTFSDWLHGRAKK